MGQSGRIIFADFAEISRKLIFPFELPFFESPLLLTSRCYWLPLLLAKDGGSPPAQNPLTGNGGLTKTMGGNLKIRGRLQFFLQYLQVNLGQS